VLIAQFPQFRKVFRIVLLRGDVLHELFINEVDHCKAKDQIRFGASRRVSAFRFGGGRRVSAFRFGDGRRVSACNFFTPLTQIGKS
jgi:hypothetical protein